MSAENRQRPRKQLRQFLTVLDAGGATPLGRMVDISQAGMMLIGHAPLSVQQEYLVDIQLPPPETSLRLRAICMWSRHGTTNTAHHGSGFRFDGLTEEQQALLDRLIQAENPG